MSNDDEKMTRLKVCPFCGNTKLRVRAVTHDLPPTPREEWMWYGLIDCFNEHGSHLSFQTNNYFKTKDEAVADVVGAWNTRKEVPRKCCGNCHHTDSNWCVLVKKEVDFRDSGCSEWRSDE